MGQIGNRGISALAAQLDNRMAEHTDRNLILDFGTINSNRCLVTNTFRVPIDPSDYSVCGRMASGSTKLKKGDRVLVAWAGDEPVVIDKVVKGSSL